MSRYNLRTKKYCPVYTDAPAHQVLKGFTFRYQTYEKEGEITRLIDKANIRYGDHTIIENIEEFVNTYKEYIPNYGLLLYIVNSTDDILSGETIDDMLANIKDTIMNQIRTHKIHEKLNDDKNINEHFLEINKFLYSMKDFVLLLIKYKALKGSDYFPMDTNLYNLVQEYMERLYEKYKKQKQRGYDRQKVPMLYNHLPTDVCKYVIKEFL